MGTVDAVTVLARHMACGWVATQIWCELQFSMAMPISTWPSKENSLARSAATDTGLQLDERISGTQHITCAAFVYGLFGVRNFDTRFLINTTKIEEPGDWRKKVFQCLAAHDIAHRPYGSQSVSQSKGDPTTFGLDRAPGF